MRPISAIRSHGHALWRLRRSPRPAVRLAWWCGAATLTGLALSREQGRIAALVLWVVFNTAIAAAACLWISVHPRAVLRTWETALQWAFWLSLAATMAVAAAADPILARVAATLPLPTSSLLATIAIATWPIIFGACALFGIFGAALGAFASRRAAAGRDEIARSAIGAFWLAMLGAIALTLAMPDLPGSEEAVAALFAGLPLCTLLLLYFVRRPSLSSRTLAQRAVGGANRLLVLQLSLFRRRRRLDLRGATFGLVAAMLLLTAQSANLIAPLQAWILVSLMQTRAALRGADASGGPGIHFAIGGPSNGIRTRAALPHVDNLVLLQMDAESRRFALTTGSETLLQAQVIRQLARWGARVIVLPLPDLVEHGTGISDTARHMLSPDLPLPDRAEIRRSVRRIPQLTAAMAKAGNVVLVETDRPNLRDIENSDQAPQPPLVKQTILSRLEAVSTPASGDLPAFHTARLPGIEFGARGKPTAPPVVAAMMRGEPPYVRIFRDHVDTAGVHLPTVARGTALVEFIGTASITPFASVAYSTVLDAAPIYQAGSGNASEGAWRDPAQFFKGKAVFLDSLLPSQRETPIGPVPTNQLLAYATATILSGTGISAADPAVVWVRTLLLGAFVGSLCVRRPPFVALWRAAMVLFVVIAGTLFTFLAAGRWADPILPSAVIAVAFMLVTQFTFSIEQGERETTRQILLRFVAPQFVEQLLDHPERLGLGGTRQSVCVLFADVRNFTGFAERHSPEEVMDVVNQYMAVLTDALDAHGGILDKYTGDGLMAIFPVGQQPREGVARAVRAALAMSAAAELLSADQIAAGKEPLNVGIGLHYGDAVVGLVGNPVRQINYTALGHTVVVSARLQTLAAGGEVVVSDAVANETDGAFALQGGELVQVKGVTAPVRAYKVLPPPA